MRFREYTRVSVLALTLLSTSCGSDGGGEVNSQAALQAFMETVALDFAQVLTDAAAPAAAVTAVQKATANCPEGGTATWTETQLGSGTLNMVACRMRGIDVSGNLSGFLSADDMSMSAQLSGSITTSGSFTANLNVQSLIVSATLPIMDATTFWEIRAITMDNEMICAWSGGGPCQDQFL